MSLPEAQLQVTISVRARDLKKDLDAAFGKLERATVRSLEEGKTGAFRATSKKARAGFKEVQKEINKRLRNFHRGSEEGLKIILSEILDTAKELTPVRSGNLKASGFYATERLQTVIRGRVGYQIVDGNIPSGVSALAPYAVYVHEGTQSQQAQPFLLEAFQQYEHMIGNTIAEEIKTVF